MFSIYHWQGAKIPKNLLDRSCYQNLVNWKWASIVLRCSLENPGIKYDLIGSFHGRHWQISYFPIRLPHAQPDSVAE